METKPGKAQLLREIEETWTPLNEAINGLSEEQMTTIRDAEGWAVKDHLVHIAAWERSVVVFLQGRPRYEGLGVDEQIYRTGEDDAINAVIQAQHKDESPADAQGEMRAVHSQLMSLIEPMSDEDLYRGNSDFQPDHPGDRDERPIIGMIYSNTANHYREHLEWIKNLAR